MDYAYSRQGLEGREKKLERLFEIVPGAASWTLLGGMCLLSFFRPLTASVLFIAFYLYWVLRVLYMTIFLTLSYMRLWVERETDWMERIREIDGGYLPGPRAPGLRALISRRIHEKKMREAQGSAPPRSPDIHHLVIIPVANETKKTLEPGVAAIASSRFPPVRMIVVLSVEERSGDGILRDVNALKESYGHRFAGFMVVVHPDKVPGEAAVKGANCSFGAKQAQRYLTERGIDPEKVIVSCFDADTVVGPDYFSCLTYHFLVTPRRLRSGFQPIPVYHNNFWDVPGFSRILDVGASFFQLVEATNPEQLVSFSSHSISFSSLAEAGYWPVDMISDDSAIFWKSLIRFDGDYRVVPIYTTVSMDVTTGESFAGAFGNVYKQKRRWAWGIENFPIVMRAFIRDRSIPLARKSRDAFRLFEGFLSWATWSFILTFVGWLPLLCAGRSINDSLFFYSAPRIKFVIFSLSFTGLAACIAISFLLLPREKEGISLRRKLLHIAEWLTVPLVSIFLGAVPALEAQTRLMTGRYLEFFVTPKFTGREKK
ncbi:MAG: glycosyltransferase [Deltaproteobacteria bacterium]